MLFQKRAVNSLGGGLEGTTLEDAEAGGGPLGGGLAEAAEMSTEKGRVCGIYEWVERTFALIPGRTTSRPPHVQLCIAGLTSALGWREVISAESCQPGKPRLRISTAVQHTDSFLRDQTLKYSMYEARRAVLTVLLLCAAVQYRCIHTSKYVRSRGTYYSVPVDMGRSMYRDVYI